MKLSIEDKTKLENMYQDYLNNEKILKMKEVSMHRGSNTYIHSFKVCKLALKRALRRRKRLNLEAILVASILHDYYLYDWRINREMKKHHAKRHPIIASENAKRDFNIDDFVCDIIKEHMWPYNFKLFPKTKEARIVSNADNTIATKEALTSRKHKNKNMDKYYNYIQKLFD